MTKDFNPRAWATVINSGPLRPTQSLLTQNSVSLMPPSDFYIGFVILPRPSRLRWQYEGECIDFVLPLLFSEADPHVPKYRR